MNIDLGDGNDRADLDFLTGVQWIANDLFIDVHGGDGDDDLDVRLDLNLARIDLDADMGDGQDDVYVRKGGNIYEDVSMSLYGGADMDYIYVACNTASPTGDIDIDFDATLNVDLAGQGGSGDDVRMYYTGTVRGVLEVKSSGGDGDDYVHTALDLKGNSIGSVKAYVSGDGAPGESGNDTLVETVRNANGVDLYTGIFGGAGSFDRATRTLNVTWIIGCEDVTNVL
jgi:hypothetical protein